MPPSLRTGSDAGLNRTSTSGICAAIFWMPSTLSGYVSASELSGVRSKGLPQRQ